MSARRAGLAALVAGLLLIGLLHDRTAVPPLFDGLPLPTSPYSYCAAPADLAASNKPPQGGENDLPVLNGQVAGGALQTADGQVVVFLGLGALKAPSGASSVRITVDPLCTTAPSPPAGWAIHGNVYRIGAAAVPNTGPVTVASSYHLTMRYPPGAFQDLQYYDGSAWHPLPTRVATGGNPYAGATLTALGDIAAMAPVGAKAPGVFSSIGSYVGFFVVLVFVLLFGTIAVVQEVRRRRRPASRRAKR